jgi:ribosome-binding protein aMBF1 (putative translation factor)
VTDTKERGNKERSFERSEFGKCLVDLMYSRGIFTATELAAAMREDGEEVTDRLIRQLWSRRSRPSHEVMRGLARTLNLTLREKARLATSVYYDDEWRGV